MTDQLNRYIFPNEHVRGELVQLDQSFAKVIGMQSYPLAVNQLLGEMLAAAALLSATLKFEGEISFQVQSEGIIKYAVVDVTHDQKVRGVARWDETVSDWPKGFAQLFSKGVLAITITPHKGERYQGIVNLGKDSLAACLEDYFLQSEQLPTRVILKTSVDEDKPKAAGMLLQILPQSSDVTERNQQLGFEDLSVLTETISGEEMFALDAKTLLHRLYHEYEVELFTPKTVVFGCTCSKQRSGEALKNINKAELLSIIAEEGAIKMDCQYCHAQYVFDQMDVESIHAGFGNSISTDSRQ